MNAPSSEERLALAIERAIVDGAINTIARHVDALRSAAAAACTRVDDGHGRDILVATTTAQRLFRTAEILAETYEDLFELWPRPEGTVSAVVSPASVSLSESPPTSPSPPHA